MPPMDRARLTIEADVDGDGTKETGVFEFLANVEIAPRVEQGFLGSGGSLVWSLFNKLLGDGESQRQNAYLDVGGGLHAIEIDFRSWEGAVDQSGNPLQWGASDDPSVEDKTTATGAHPLTQLNVLEEYVTVAEIDSRNPATLEYGERHDGGLYDPLNVVVEGPQMTRSAEDKSWFDGTLTCISAADLNEAIDAVERLEY